MLKILTVTAASLAMLSAAAAADLPRKEPPPPAAPVGKAPIGKYPVGKAPIGKYPQPVAARGSCDVTRGARVLSSEGAELVSTHSGHC